MACSNVFMSISLLLIVGCTLLQDSSAQLMMSPFYYPMSLYYPFAYPYYYFLGKRSVNPADQPHSEAVQQSADDR
uniref:Uncharacterized protein n=1 Tax=Globodera rostochiensis TaxID=31243 RepID=A0A914I9N4_GLORO